MHGHIDLTLCIYYINPLATYRLSSSTPPHTIAEWYGPGHEPTPQELEAAWLVVSDPDWIDPGAMDCAKARMLSHRNLALSPGWADWTVQQAQSWIEDNVTDLASAKLCLKAMARILVDLRDFTCIMLEP